MAKIKLALEKCYVKLVVFHPYIIKRWSTLFKILSILLSISILVTIQVLAEVGNRDDATSGDATWEELWKEQQSVSKEVWNGSNPYVKNVTMYVSEKFPDNLIKPIYYVFLKKEVDVVKLISLHPKEDPNDVEVPIYKKPKKWDASYGKNRIVFVTDLEKKTAFLGSIKNRLIIDGDLKNEVEFPGPYIVANYRFIEPDFEANEAPCDKGDIIDNYSVDIRSTEAFEFGIYIKPKTKAAYYGDISQEYVETNKDYKTFNWSSSDLGYLSCDCTIRPQAIIKL